ncbi:ES1 protein homolog, mitochondrial-like [Cimex lectularius]|uniref:ES1 protein homolog, mitochondrial n=1 Tax=Cimex lectularius TaxID=79782 RepID=A0A8I6R855_CIMLE|nr:ES1 protein homolog, mitochondrial-like [Cimex lectularius]
MLRTFATRLLKARFTCQTNNYSNKSCQNDRFAVVLSGCGVFDGTEIHEAAHILSHLTRAGVNPVMFAPEMPHCEIVNHNTGDPEPKVKRGVLDESARIARGPVRPLSELASLETTALFQAVIFPGGFGVAKNLSNFATHGPACTVHPEVVKVIQNFHSEKKPIGLACIAPILVARVLGNVRITLGKDLKCDGWPHHGAIQAAKDMGATVESKDYNEVSYDEKNQIFSTPAFMYNGKFHEISDGLEIFIKFMILNMQQSKKN